jgi:hypothetical protein
MMSDGHVVLKIEGDDSGLRDTLAGLNDIGQNALQGLLRGMESNAAAAAAVAGELAANVTGILNELDGHDAGVNAALGVAAGITAGTGAAVAAAQNLAAKVAAAMRTELGIQSPSKVAEEIALYFNAGLIQGLLGGAGDVSDATRVMASGVIQAAQAGLSGVASLPGLAAGAAVAAPYAGERHDTGHCSHGSAAAEQRIVIDFASGSDAKRLFYAYAEEGERLTHGK